MDAQMILEIKPALTTYLHELDGCFANVRSQRHLETYVAGQLERAIDGAQPDLDLCERVGAKPPNPTGKAGGRGAGTSPTQP